jgi:hypothetical protein
MGENPANWQTEIAALRLGLDLGMSLIDTAEMYGDGAAEELIREAIAGLRTDVFLVSKVLPQHATLRGTIEACGRSLQLCLIDFRKWMCSKLGALMSLRRSQGHDEGGEGTGAPTQQPTRLVQRSDFARESAHSRNPTSLVERDHRLHYHRTGDNKRGHTLAFSSELRMVNSWRRNSWLARLRTSDSMNKHKEPREDSFCICRQPKR